MARRAPHRILLNLGLDSLIACLALPVALLLDSPGAWPEEAWWLGALPGAVLALLAAGLLRRPAGYPLGWLTQLVGVGLGLLTPSMFVVGLMFAALWVVSFVLGKRLDGRASPA